MFGLNVMRSDATKYVVRNDITKERVIVDLQTKAKEIAKELMKVCDTEMGSQIIHVMFGLGIPVGQSMTIPYAASDEQIRRDQEAFIANLAPHELCDLIADIYLHQPPTGADPRRIARYQQACQVRLDEDNGQTLAIELLFRVRHSFI